jgi:hypothetical protein
MKKFSISEILIMIACALVLSGSIIFLFNQIKKSSNYDGIQQIKTQNKYLNTRTEPIIEDNYFKIESIDFTASNFNGLIYGDNGNPLDPQPNYEPETDIRIELTITELKDKKIKDLKISDLKIYSDAKSVSVSTNNYRVEGATLIISATVPPNNFEIDDTIYATFKLTADGYTSQEIKTPTGFVDVSI